MAMSKTKRQSELSQATAQIPQTMLNAEDTLQIPGVRLCVSPNQTQQQMLDAYHEAIRDLSYQKWEAAGSPGGDGVEFWLEAEQEVMAFQAMSFEA